MKMVNYMIKLLNEGDSIKALLKLLNSTVIHTFVQIIPVLLFRKLYSFPLVV